MRDLVLKLVRPYYGSNRVSRFLRRHIERLSPRQVIGVPLAGMTFFAAVIMPGAGELTSAVEVARETQMTVVEVVPTQAKLQWPLNRFGLSQRFTSGHPGVDLTDPYGTSIYPVAAGNVVMVRQEPWGYGKHLVVTHEDDIKSLYAHLSTIEVREGDAVTRETKIGEIGSTGWATGNHLHLEIYQGNTPINPLEVLPTIQ
jgi:murein DD-endopeptidase MepM/ murein hydrolase activator NlpD